jgi:Mrp family chromosome partitioning ATPase
MVLVIRSASTKRKLLLRSKQELERNGIKILGSVLNGVKESDINDYYYYQYYK